MSEEILINVTAHETRVATIWQNTVEEIHLERSASRGQVGNIYLGRVLRVLPGMQSAFIDIGLEKAAFLHAADIWHSRDINSPLIELTPPIEKLIHDGQTIMVQVTKDPISNKGARLTTQISIAGRTLVYLPQTLHIGVSQKIDGEIERELIRQRLTDVIPPSETGGYIIRTLAEDASSETLASDVAYLRKTWLGIEALAGNLPPRSLLYRDLNLSERVLRDMVNDDTSHILIDCKKTYEKLLRFVNALIPSVAKRLKCYNGSRALFDLFGVENEIEKALSKRVDLKSGGYLVIEQTEAMTTIDVNTGGFIGVRNFTETIYKTNLEAAQSIARQLRLRNLGGIIIIDFIDMDNEDHRSSVLTTFNEALARDRTKSKVGQFSPLGLVEMTRKRTRESLAHVLCQPCTLCHARNQIKTPRTLCYEILREIQREAQIFNPRQFCIVAAPVIIDSFLEEESIYLAAMSDQIGKPITLQAESHYHPEKYDIIIH